MSLFPTIQGPKVSDNPALDYVITQALLGRGTLSKDL